MKHIYLIVTAISVLSFLSCNDKNQNELVLEYTDLSLPVIVSDKTGKSASITVQVIADEAQHSASFAWHETLITLGENSKWSATLCLNCVATSNTSTLEQYVLSWNGNLSGGSKLDALLKTVKDGEVSQTTHLSSLSVAESKGYYTITFMGESKSGEFYIKQ